MNDVTQRDLAQYDDAWGGAEEPGGGDFQPWPDGKYTGATVVVAELRKTKKGDPMVTFAYTHPRGDGWHWDNNVITGDSRKLGFLKKKLRLFGVEVGRLSDLTAQLAPLVGAQVSIQITTKEVDDKIFINTYALDAPVEAMGTEPEDDDIPF